MATSDFSVRLRSCTRTSGSKSAPSLSSARAARLRAQPQWMRPSALRGVAERQTNILGDRHPFDQAEVLMDEGDRHAAHRMGHVLAVVGDRAAVGDMHARQHLDERRLAGAVLAEQRDDLALADVHADVEQRLRAAEPLGERAHLKHGARLSAVATSWPLRPPPARVCGSRASTLCNRREAVNAGAVARQEGAP